MLIQNRHVDPSTITTASFIIGMPLIGFYLTFEGIISESIIPTIIDHRFLGTVFVLWSIWQAVFNRHTFLGISTIPSIPSIAKLSNFSETMLIIFLVLMPVSALTLEINSQQAAIDQIRYSSALDAQFEQLMYALALFVHNIAAYLIVLVLAIKLSVFAINCLTDEQAESLKQTRDKISKITIDTTDQHLSKLKKSYSDINSAIRNKKT